jgi:hypothetical protein
MAIDPSIIGNVMVPRAPQMPDVNAMMQTRTAGMENVYKIERQRAEDAKAAQAAEADETVKALIPAYAYALGNPSDLTGALDLAPPELRGALEPYVAQLQGKPPEQVQAALIGSLSSSEVGRAFLEAQGRMQTAEIQRGQLTLAQQKAAAEAEAAARGPAPKFEIRETDIGLVRVNPATGEVFPIETPGAAAGIPGPRAGAVTTPDATAPISTEQPPNGAILQPKAKAASTEQTQEERRRAASVRYTVKNVDRALNIIDKNPEAFGQGADEFALSLLPFGAGEDFMAFVQDADRQQLNYRMTQIVATLLRLETGAAYTKPELATEAASFMQKYGDKPETARDKLDALQDRVSSAVGSTGRAWTDQDQAEYDAAMVALDVMKEKLYPAGGGGSDAGDVDTSNPLLQD